MTCNRLVVTESSVPFLCLRTHTTRCCSWINKQCSPLLSLSEKTVVRRPSKSVGQGNTARLKTMSPDSSKMAAFLPSFSARPALVSFSNITAKDQWGADGCSLLIDHLSIVFLCHPIASIAGSCISLISTGSQQLLFLSFVSMKHECRRLGSEF